MYIHDSFFTSYFVIRLQETNSVSKLVTDWNTWPKCVFFIIFFFLSNRRVTFGSVTNLFSMKYGTWFMDQKDTRQNTELKKSVVQSVLLCLSYLFMYILTSKFIKSRVAIFPRKYVYFRQREILGNTEKYKISNNGLLVGPVVACLHVGSWSN